MPSYGDSFSATLGLHSQSPLIFGMHYKSTFFLNRLWLSGKLGVVWIVGIRSISGLPAVFFYVDLGCFNLDFGGGLLFIEGV